MALIDLVYSLFETEVHKVNENDLVAVAVFTTFGQAPSRFTTMIDLHRVKQHAPYIRPTA